MLLDGEPERLLPMIERLNSGNYTFQPQGEGKILIECPRAFWFPTVPVISRTAAQERLEDRLKCRRNGDPCLGAS
jgi:hypothetical protein